MEERLFQHLFLTTSLWISPISAILRNSVQIWISLTRQATTMPGEEKKSKSKDEFFFTKADKEVKLKEYKSQRNQKMLFYKCNPTIPSVVLPRPAWQEKAHCVAAGSFFIFIIYELVYFLSLGSWSRYYCFENHGFLSICWSFHVFQVSFNFVFRDTCFLLVKGVDLFQRVDKNVKADFGWTSLLHYWNSHTLKLDNIIACRLLKYIGWNERI